MHSSDTMAALEALSQGFRKNYLRYDQITAQLHAWAKAFPHLAHVHSIGRSPEGRELWLLTLGPEPSRTRPAVWIDGNMHATELCGSSVALAVAEDVLRLHLSPETNLHGLPAHVRTRLRDVLFYILPRMSPDGAEAVLRDGRYVRSNPRDRRPDRLRPRWVCTDIDGDGLSLLMRKPDPTGEFVESTEVPGLLLPRRIEDPGPFYKVYPEGMIEPWDGNTVPDPHFLSDNDTDLNRNFPWSWMPEPEQEGSGAYPLSEPEARAVVEFATAHPEIFAWINLHTFGGVYIRPLGHAPDKNMHPFDLAVYRQIAEWGDALSGYPMVSGFEEFLYEPDKPLHGDLADFAYHQRGALAFVCELWDLFHQLGIERKKPFVDHYTHLTRDELVKLGRWDIEHNHQRILRPWKKCLHPQLGEVEVGGLDPRVGISNPPYETLSEVCARQSAVFLRVASLAPALRLTRTQVTPLGDGTHNIELTVENHGYLPTYILGSAKSLPWNEPLRMEITPEGCTLVSPTDRLREIGHLEGWGRGLFATSMSLFHQRSRGNVSSRTLHWVVSGQGSLTVRIGSCRVGWITEHIQVR